MLGDLRLFRKVTDDDALLVRISPQLFFSTLLLSARAELGDSNLTMDRDGADELAHFDGGRLPAFIRPRGVIDYLLAVLVSLVRIARWYYLSEWLYRTLARSILKPFDLERLTACCAALVDRERFDASQHIGVLSLFFAGMPGLDSVPAGDNANPLPLSMWDCRRAEFFALAAPHSDSSLGRAFQSLSEGLSIATKPLRLVSSNYLGPLRDSLFTH